MITYTIMHEGAIQMIQIFFSVMLFSSAILAQSLTLQTSIDKALRHYPEIKASNLQIERSAHSYDAVFSEYLPQIDLRANYNFQQTFVFPQNGFFNTVDDRAWSTGASLKQKIWDFSKTYSKILASKVDKQISKLSLNEAKALLAYKVKSLYESMVVQREAIKVREKDLEVKEAYYKQSLAFVEQGLKTRADSSRFLSALYLSKSNLGESQATFNKAKNSLSLYIGEEIADDVILQKDILYDNIQVKSDIKQKILEKNYALRIGMQDIKKNRLLHKSAQALHFGSLDAVASYDHINSLNEYDSKVVGVTLNIPLYSGGRINALSQEAALSTQIASEQKASQELALKEEIQNLLEDIKHFTKTITAKKAQLEASSQTTQLLDARYKEGLATYIEVLDASALQLDAKLGLLNAQYEYSSTIHRLEYLQGNI